MGNKLICGRKAEHTPPHSPVTTRNPTHPINADTTTGASSLRTRPPLSEQEVLNRVFTSNSTATVESVLKGDYKKNTAYKDTYAFLEFVHQNSSKVPPQTIEDLMIFLAQIAFHGKSNKKTEQEWHNRLNEILKQANVERDSKGNFKFIDDTQAASTSHEP